MGQMTYGVLFGVKKAPPKSLGGDGWYEMTFLYEPDQGPPLAIPSGDNDFDGIGFWCAVGASGEDGVPDLTGFPLDDFAGGGREHRKALAAAQKAWQRFAEWCSVPQSGTIGSGEWKRAWTMKPIVLPKPRLYLVQTEVA